MSDLLDLQRDPAAFRAALLIDTDGGPMPFADVIDPWQSDDFAALDSGWVRAVVGKREDATHQRAWLERPRGHSKSLDLGVMAAWALFAGRRRLSGIGCAADQDQARLLRDAVGKLVFFNPWLGKVLEVQNNRVVNVHTESTLDIIASDAKSSYGLTPDFIIADEVCHWKNGDMWESLLSSAGKRSTCMFVCITNAGIQDDWVWAIREAVRVHERWFFHRLDGPVATWMTPDVLAEQERLLPPVAYRRLWLNEWGTGGGDALTREVIDAAFHPDLSAMSGAQPGYDFVGGLDLGISRDASAFVVLAVRRTHDGHGAVRLAHVRVWRPAKGRKVNLDEVEQHVAEMHERFRLKSLSFDPWQASHLASRLQAGQVAVQTKQMKKIGITRKVPMTEVPQTGTALQRMATVLIEAFNDHRCELFEHPDLRRDLIRFRIEERSYGFRLVSPKDQHGHGDVGSAFTLALVSGMELANKRRFSVGTLDGRGGTPLDRAFADIDRQNAENARIAAMPDDNPIRDLMRRVGRV